MKRTGWIMTIIIVASVMRLLFYLHYPAYQSTGDSVTYYLTAKSMVASRVFADTWRTPVYPMIIAGAYMISGNPMPQEFPYMSYELLSIRVAQSIAGVLALIVLYYLLLSLEIPQTYAGVYCLFMACNRTLMAFEHQILTEAFSVFILLCIVYILILLLKHFQWKYFFLLSALSIFVVFLRPSYIALPLVVCAIISWRYHKKFVIMACISITVLYASLLFIYAQTNYIHSQYRGISRISDVNMLGKILTLHLPIATAPDAAGVKEIVTEYLTYSKDTNPWSVFRAYPQLYRNDFAKPLGEFARSVIRSNMGAYFLAATKQIPSSLIDVSEVNDIAYATPRFGFFFFLLEKLYYYVQYINLLVLLAAPLYILKGIWRRNDHVERGYMVISIIALYHIAFAVYLGYADFARHLSVVQPILYILSFSFVVRIARLRPTQ